MPQPRNSLDATGGNETSGSVSLPAEGAAAALANRIFVHTRPKGVTRLLPAADQNRSGIILCGASPERGLKRCRDAHFKGILAIDPCGYEDGLATPDAPFTLSPEGQLFPPSLDQALDDQRAAGADMCLTPTRFIDAGDAPSLKAAAREAANLDRNDTIFSVPINIAWLNTTYINQLIAVLARVPMPKGIFLGAQLDPLQNVVEAVANIRRLCAEVDSVSVFRTDFEAFDAVAHGALSASIGTSGALRHITPPGEETETIVKNQSPSVLVPELIHFFKGSTIARKFANTTAPACGCAMCMNRRLDTFLGPQDSTAADLHNVRVWMEWLPTLIDHGGEANRIQWWQGLCDTAVANHEIYNTQLRIRNAFRPPHALTVWADRSLRTSRAQQPIR